MNNRLSLWLGGYLCVEIKGVGIERFMNLCTNNKLYLYNIEKYDKRIRFNIDVKSYKRIRKIVRKTHIVPRIIGKYGCPFLVEKANERKSFWIGIMLAIVIFYTSSLFVWDIRIEGEKYYTDNDLKHYLEDENIRWGMLVKNIECDKIEDDIRNKYKDIGWVSAQVKGTRVIVKIKENIRFDEKDKNKKKVARHIVAPVEGTVKSILVKSGEPCVTVGQEVKKGQMLVCGIMDIVDDGGNIVNKHGIYADADIEVERDKEYFYSAKREYKKKSYTDNIRRKIEIKLRQKSTYRIWPLIRIKKFDNFDVLVNNYNVSLGQNLEVPLEIITYKEREYIFKDDNYSDRELLDKAHKYFDRYKKELKKENVSILDSRIDNYVDNKFLYSKGYVTLLYKDMDYINVEEKELKEDIKKEVKSEDSIDNTENGERR